VWQVLVGFLAFSWLVVTGVGLATRYLGLPTWTPSMAAVLMALGLPMVLATTLVQGGLPGLRMQDVMDPNDLEGLTPADVHVVPQAHPLYASRLFTWRNAILGGVMAGCLLVTTVVSYLAMWALGIGPVGSLLAQGVLERGDRVEVRVFDAPTQLTGVAETWRASLVDELRRSELVTVRDASPDAGVDGVAPVVLQGSVMPLSTGGTEIAVSVLVAGERLVARYRAEVRDNDDAIRAVASLAGRVRIKLGESRRSIDGW
jgi:hypothetical protein